MRQTKKESTGKIVFYGAKGKVQMELPDVPRNYFIKNLPNYRYMTLNVMDDAIQRGIRLTEVKKTMTNAKIPYERVGKILGKSWRSLSGEKKLPNIQGEKYLKLIRIMDLGMEVFGSKDRFFAWLNESVPALEYRIPLDVLEEPFGLDKIEDALYQIDYSIV